VTIIERLLIEKPHRKRSLGKPRCRYEGNTSMNLTNIEWEGAQ
jgi:hypothetical protein